MYSSRLLLQYGRRPLNQFLEQGIYQKYAVCQPSTGDVVAFATSKVIKCLKTCNEGESDNILQKMSSTKSFADGVVRKKKISVRIITKSNDPDVFGDVKDFSLVDDLDEKIGEESTIHNDCEIFIPLDRKYRSPEDYFNGMKNLVKEKKLKQALDLFLDMRRHRVPSEPRHFTFMIGACGRAGYTEMAFKLLRQMTDKGFKPTAATLTGLFNSCAEATNADYGLKKATFLKRKISLKSWEVTLPTYHAMIKAFGKCGDIKTAFEIVDEMIESEFRPTEETYNALLIGCISDKDAGFTYAVEVWRKMISKRLHPNIFSYNLLLRAVRDCGVGPEEVSCNLLQHWSSCHPRLTHSAKTRGLSREDVLALPTFPRQSIKLLSSPLSHGDNNQSLQGKGTSTIGENEAEYLPEEENVIEKDVLPVSNTGQSSTSSSPAVLNLLAPRPVDGVKLIDLKNIRYPADKLFLIGGVKGVLKLMRNDDVTPDIKTFTILLRVIPNSTECEHELLALMEAYQFKPDVDFFNNLIKKRNFRKNFRAAKEALVLITKQGLYPDIVTFGVLALGCNRADGLQLLSDMKILGFCPNVEIFGALLNAASRLADFEYVCDLLKAMKTERIKPSPKFLQMLEMIKNTAHAEILELERGKEASRLPFTEKSYNKFCELYEQWLKNTDVEEEADPCLQYETEIKDVVREIS